MPVLQTVNTVNWWIVFCCSRKFCLCTIVRPAIRWKKLRVFFGKRVPHSSPSTYADLTDVLCRYTKTTNHWRRHQEILCGLSRAGIYYTEITHSSLTGIELDSYLSRYGLWLANETVLMNRGYLVLVYQLWRHGVFRDLANFKRSCTFAGIDCDWRTYWSNRSYLTIRPIARKGCRSKAHEADPIELLTRDPWERRV